MSNLGLHLAMRNEGITVHTTAVGDRYVLEELRAGGYALGGEQSGHVVMPAHATTGDGLLTALRLMARMATTHTSLAELASVVTVLPQVLENVRVADKEAVAASDDVRAAVADAERELGDSRSGAAAALGHRTARPGDGRGGHRRAGEGDRRPHRRGGRRSALASAAVRQAIGQLSDAHAVGVVDPRAGRVAEPRPVAPRGRRP
jgi:hypothetical protein